MSTNYNSKKKAELEALLKERGLSHSGNKADLVARLQGDDTGKGDTAATPAATATGAAAAADEEKIDWGDEDMGAADNGQDAAAEGTDQAAPDAADQAQASSSAAAVPDQVAGTEADPTSTDDVKVSGEPDSVSASKAEGDDAGKPTKEELEAKKKAEEEKFRAGLAASTADAEAEKRRKRAERFGIKVSDGEQKAAERAKRFGTVNEDAGKSVALLDSALPERRERKRERERADEGRRGNKRVDSRKREQRPRNEARSGLNDSDRLAAQRRLDRFGGGKQAAASN